MDLTRHEMQEIEREYCRRSLPNFIRRAWAILEPSVPYVHGWHIDAIADHLEAVTNGDITRLYVAVPPGCMKSLMVSVFWPAWEWGPRAHPSYRYLGTSHSQSMAIRDNIKSRRLITSPWFMSLWGDKVLITGDQNEKTKYENTMTGFRQAMAFTGMTGARGDRVLVDDPMSVDDANSDPKRKAILTTFQEALPTRLNNPEKSAIVVIQQRLHQRDVIGLIEAKNLGYEGLVLPMEYEKTDRVTSIGFRDPRTQEGELLFPERFPREVVDRDKKIMGQYAVAGQFQQRPVPRGGGMFQREWFEVVPAAPVGVRWVRGWDLAATEKTDSNDPAYTAGVKLGVSPDGTYYIGHAVRRQVDAAKVLELIKNTAKQDGRDVPVDLPQDPGQAGKSQKLYYVKQLAGWVVYCTPETGSKELRAQPVASQAEAGNIKVVEGDWNEDFLTEIESFPNGAFKDQVDALSRAFARLVVDDNEDEDISEPIFITGG